MVSSGTTEKEARFKSAPLNLKAKVAVNDSPVIAAPVITVSEATKPPVKAPVFLSKPVQSDINPLKPVIVAPKPAEISTVPQSVKPIPTTEETAAKIIVLQEKFNTLNSIMQSAADKRAAADPVKLDQAIRDVNTTQQERQIALKQLFDIEKDRAADYVKNPMKEAPTWAKVASTAGEVIATLGAGAAVLEKIKDNKTKKMEPQAKPLDSTIDEVKESARGVVTGTTAALNDQLLSAKQNIREKLANLVNPKEVVQAGAVPSNNMPWIIILILAVFALPRILK